MLKRGSDVAGETTVEHHGLNYRHEKGQIKLDYAKKSFFEKYECIPEQKFVQKKLGNISMY